MKRKLTLFTILVMSGICLFMFAACTGEEEATVELCFEEYDDWNRTSPDTDPTSDDLEGEYTLVGFILDYYIDGEFAMSLDENDFSSYSGTMNITASTVSQSITLEGDNFIVNATYTNSPVDSLSGTLHINQGGQMYEADYSISGGVLTTDSGLVCEDVPEGVFTALGVEERAFGGLAAPSGY